MEITMDKEEWSLVIEPKRSLLDINLKEIWEYRDLIFMFVKRDFTTFYKQTVLGPLWVILSPLMSTSIFTVVFGIIAGISTDDIPQFVFYMSGNILWSYFANCLTKTSNTFAGNARIFGKVYFPRLVMPVSVTISGLINFAIQLVLFIVIMVIYIVNGSAIAPNIYILLTPFLVLEAALLALGFGIIVSSLTTKYRDLAVLVSFCVQLWMYATPVVYPVSQAPGFLKDIILLNPMAPIIETFRYAFLGRGAVPVKYLIISAFTTLAVLIIGVLIFNKVEKTFMDTV
ncbi:MAG: ABC transporter permease [Lachnospiraceae bacterium]|nr:ABC transporter permease [Lachnospiraceae bacterium]